MYYNPLNGINVQTKDVNVLACAKCNCTWLHKIAINQFLDLNTGITEGPVAVYEEELYVLICIKCGHVVKHSTIGENKPTNTLAYDKMLNEIFSDDEKQKAPKTATVKIPVNVCAKKTFTK